MKRIATKFQGWDEFQDIKRAMQYQRGCNPLIKHEKQNGALFLLSDIGILMVPYDSTLIAKEV